MYNHSQSLTVDSCQYSIQLDIDSKDIIQAIKITSSDTSFQKKIPSFEKVIINESIYDCAFRLFEILGEKEVEENSIIFSQVLKLAYDSYSNSNDSLDFNHILCPCFKINQQHVSEVASYYNKEFHQEDLKTFLLKQFPFLSACNTCEVPLQNFIRNFQQEDFREPSWKDKSNKQWIKDIYLQLPNDVEIYDFYNGKLFIVTDLTTSDIEEHIKMNLKQDIRAIKLQ